MTAAARLGVLGAFVLGMPLLALPSVLGLLVRREAAGPPTFQLADGPAGPAAMAASADHVAQAAELANAPGLGTVAEPGAAGELTNTGNVASADGAPGPPDGAAAPSADNPFPTPESKHQSETAQQRLRALGARVFTLQFLPGQEPPFVARCQVGLPDTPALRKGFEARGERPVDAMLEVLDQVERWHQRVARAATRRR